MSKRSLLAPVFLPQAYLVEVAWEVCNQVGGIYTVIRSKVPVMMEQWAGRYCLIGPYVHPNISAELEPLDDIEDIFGQAAASLRKRGYDVHYAEWLVTGKPRVVLLNPNSVDTDTLNVIKYLLWQNHGISTPGDNALINQVVSFGYLTKLFIDELMKLSGEDHKVITHFHEWMGGLPILDIKREGIPVKTIFTTHATQLGRHLAINSPQFYSHLPFFQWEDEARKFGVETEATMEFKIAQSCDYFTTVSDLTARECEYLLKREVDAILPNGLNIQRFETLYEFQNLHSEYKEQIHDFIMGHFFHSYSFDLDKTMYFFTSGRFEFKNKGFDLTLEALSYLNEQLKREGSDVTVVMFFVSKRDYYSIKPETLHSHAVMEEIRQTCDAILKQVGSRLFYESTSRNDHHLPNLNDFVDEYWKLRYRRTIQSWKTNNLPSLVTHNLVDEEHDEVMKTLQEKNLLNHKDDKVKVVYHPDFISSTNPLFGMDYLHFVRGCNLGVFPSYYEPWGYTPLEALASGIPAVTSDLSGFGDYLLNNFPDHEKNGIFVVERSKRTFDWSARQLAAYMYRFLKLSRRERVIQRNNAESYSAYFDWKNLILYYNSIYEKAVAR
ncbi:glycosyltransferase [Chryseosolibacter indicus]|uniref:Glycosyltransferase n=1 Tax=Chryseosolibacter indicus TaxID=2782351 RepID=A0ABS5VS74_9BACT|nr:glycosyltransferase [Chryseosolibacter indicus]MBT1703883.1 glycosyltransferase [Chryseosolibacter indicus]